MNEVGGPQDPGDGDDNPPPDAIVLGPDDMPGELAAAIEQAINERRVPTLVDHGFLLERARAAGFDEKRLRKLYPDFPIWVRKDLLNRRLTLDSRGYLYVLH